MLDEMQLQKGAWAESVTAEHPAGLWLQSSPPYILMGQGPPHLSPGSSHSLAAPSREHNEKCNPGPAQCCTKWDIDGTDEQPAHQPAAGFWETG